MEDQIKSTTKFHTDLRDKLDEYVTLIYEETKNFPKEEVFGLTSQLRRSALSVVLNHIEGFARMRKQVMKNLLEISYGSLKETKYLWYFANKQKYISNKTNYDRVVQLSEDIGKMLWGIIEKVK